MPYLCPLLVLFAIHLRQLMGLLEQLELRS
jgi:hypothetical protein